jgi:hypothetical protein
MPMHAPRTPRSTPGTAASRPNRERSDDTLEFPRRDLFGLDESAVSLAGEDPFEYTRGDSSSPIAWLDDA